MRSSYTYNTKKKNSVVVKYYNNISDACTDDDGRRRILTFSYDSILFLFVIIINLKAVLSRIDAQAHLLCRKDRYLVELFIIILYCHNRISYERTANSPGE